MTNYDLDVQKLFLSMIICDHELYIRVSSIYNSENFDVSLRGAAEFIRTHCDKYKSMPGSDKIFAITKVKLDVINDLNNGDKEWFLDDFEKFTQRQELERAILKSAELLEKGNYGPVEKLIKDAVQISLENDLGLDYFAEPKTRIMKIKDSNGQISTGWKNLDDILYGGFNRGDLNIFAGGSGSGKSLFMQNLAVNWFQRGLNGIYITLELSEEICSLRIDSITTSINSKEIFKKIDDVEYRVKMMGKKSGSFYVKYMPAQSNINHIRSYCKDFELNTGKKIDFLCIDYLDLLMPISVKVSPSDLFVKDKYVSEEIRNMAKEMNVLCVTASQLNRSAVETQEINQSHISGGISKINTADNVIGIMTSVSMRDRGMYQLQLLKTRNSNGFGKKINLDYDVETLKITDSNVDGDAGIVESLGTQIAQNPLPLNTKPVVSNTTDNKKQMLDSLLKGIKSR